jgi:hypothetical protein
MSERAEHNLRKTVEVSLFLAATACLALWLVRIYYAISFVTPYMLPTTGCEEESLFSIWKFSQHQAVYADPYRIPFAVSYFNWGYYYSYGFITSISLHLLHLDAIWIPTIGRLITVAFNLINGGIFFLTARAFVKAGLLALGPVAWAWCLIATVGPLVGFWSITVRPDMGALAFEAAGLYVILRYLRKQDQRLIIVAALLFYAAWAFKQSSVTMLTESVLALVLLERWRAFLVLSGVWWSLVSITLILGGHIFRDSILFSQGHLPLLALLGLENALRAACKNPFFLLGLLAFLVFSLRRFRLLITRPVELTLFCVVLFSSSFALVTSCKARANDNYFIPAAWATMLGVMLIWERMDSRWVLACVVACSLLTVAGIALTPTGLTYNYDYRDQDLRYRSVAEKLSHLPAPAFVILPYGNLPWVQPVSPHFVLGYTYEADRDAGVPMEDGGWEGLARDGYFGTLVIEQDYSPALPMLAKYKLVDEYRDPSWDLSFYRRIGSGP